MAAQNRILRCAINYKTHMAKTSAKLSWCKIRLGKDLNWWVNETSDKINWDIDGLSVIDPRQAAHMLETLDGLREYGLDDAIVEKAFIPFSIEAKEGKADVKITRSNESVYDADDQHLFLLPDCVDDDSPYADFLDHITKLQVKMLNDTFDFEKDVSIDELEEEIRECHNNDYMEGRAIHAFSEVMDILEYVPEGYSLEEDEDEEKEDDEETYEDIEDLPDDDEDIEEDETMHWDEDDEDEEGYGPEEEDLSDFSDEEEDERY